MPASQSAIPKRVHEVVMEVVSDTPEAQTGVIQSIRNLQRAFDAELVTIEVVCHGRGINLLLKKSPQRSSVLDLESMKVTFCACNNSLQLRHLTAKDLLKGVRIVPAGLGEIVRKEEAGWTYLRL